MNTINKQILMLMVILMLVIIRYGRGGGHHTVYNIPYKMWRRPHGSRTAPQNAAHSIRNQCRNEFGMTKCSVFHAKPGSRRAFEPRLCTYPMQNQGREEPLSRRAFEPRALEAESFWALEPLKELGSSCKTKAEGLWAKSPWGGELSRTQTA